MATTPTIDPINPPAAALRVYYSTGRMLGVEDFQAEQAYHRGRLARALLSLHGPGTVIGLNVASGTDSNGQLEVQVAPGIAIDRVGRILDVPVTVCIRPDVWLLLQSDSDLILALGTNAFITVDVFVGFAACSRGKTPDFASQDDYDATDAFQANRLLDSFAMQLILRKESSPPLPKDPWLPAGAQPAPGVAPTAAEVLALKDAILAATPVPPAIPPVEYWPGADTTSIFLARIQIAASQPSAGARPVADFTKITYDNLSRLFVLPTTLLARWIGLDFGQEA
jgi:hypothetical protein